MDWLAIKQLASGFVHRKDISWDELQPLALDAINNSLEVMENESAVSLPLVASALSGFFDAPLPVDFARPRAVFNGTQELTSLDIKGLLAQGNQGMQRFFAISGMKMIAAVSATLSVVYSTRIPVLISDSDHNFLSDRYSTIYLNALLVQAAQKIQDFDALSQHTDALDRVMAEANANYAWATQTAGAEARTPYGQVSN